MKPFEFHAELFEIRSIVIATLTEHGPSSPTDYGGVDLQHDVYGVEVTGIHHEDDARIIEDFLRTLLQDWRHSHTFYEDHNVGELGWKVIISRKPENCDNVSPIRRNLVPVFESSKPWYMKAVTASAYGMTIAVVSVVILMGLNRISRAEMFATLFLLPTLFALVGTILALIDIRRNLSKTDK